MPQSTRSNTSFATNTYNVCAKFNYKQPKTAVNLMSE